MSSPFLSRLVYRLNRSAVRFYDTRAAAGKLIETCRVLAGEAVRFADHDAMACDELCRWIVAFPVATRNFLRQTVDVEELEGRRGRALELVYIVHIWPLGPFDMDDFYGFMVDFGGDVDANGLLQLHVQWDMHEYGPRCCMESTCLYIRVKVHFGCSSSYTVFGRGSMSHSRGLVDVKGSRRP